MPLCPRCGQNNPSHQSRCARCGATLPRSLGEIDEGSRLFTFEEGREYPPPSQSYETENLVQLHLAIEDYLEEGQPEPLLDWLKYLKSGLHEFSQQGLAHLNQALEVEHRFNCQGDFHHQVGYLTSRGLALCQQALEDLEQLALQEPSSQIWASWEVFRQGNDHICEALVLIEARRQGFLEVLEQLPPQDEDQSPPQ